MPNKLVVARKRVIASRRAKTKPVPSLVVQKELLTREKNARKVFFFIGFFTTPTHGVFSLKRLAALSGISEDTVLQTIQRLRKQKLILEDGTNFFCISDKGHRAINGVGNNPQLRMERLTKMPLIELQETLESLRNAQKLVGVKVPDNELQLLEEIIAKRQS